MSGPLTYWHSGGALFGARGAAMDEADAVALYDLHMDEARAAAQAGAGPAAWTARRLAKQIDDALNSLERWRRAAMGVFAPSRTGRPPQRRNA